MYYSLDRQSVLEYVRKSPLIARIFGEKDDLTAVDLAEGNINLIFRVQSAAAPVSQSVLIKQALPYSRRYPEIKLPLDRARIESEMLLLEAKYCPDQVPKVYLYDPEMYLTAMEDLRQHSVMRYGLMGQVRYPEFPRQIGVFLASTLFHTSDFFLSWSEKKAMVPRFINPFLCKISEDLVFTQPFVDHPNNHWTPSLRSQVEEIIRDEELRSEVLMLKADFMTNAQALIHGDLHTGSIMVTESKTKVIDPEFAFFGPMGYDIGALLGNLALSYASQEYHAKDPTVRDQYREWLVQTIEEVWKIFEAEFRRFWEAGDYTQWPSERLRDKFLRKLLQDAAGMGACEMMRRVLGLAHVPDFDNIEDERTRAVAESLALNIARNWLMERREFSNVRDLTSLVRAQKPTCSV
jgi:5-methylthioribose kinase